MTFRLIREKRLTFNYFDFSLILRNQNHPHDFNLAKHRRHSAMGADAQSSAIPILFQPNYGTIYDPTGSTNHRTNTTQHQGRIQVGGGGGGGRGPFLKFETKW